MNRETSNIQHRTPNAEPRHVASGRFGRCLTTFSGNDWALKAMQDVFKAVYCMDATRFQGRLIPRRKVPHCFSAATQHRPTMFGGVR